MSSAVVAPESELTHDPARFRLGMMPIQGRGFDGTIPEGLPRTGPGKGPDRSAVP